MNFISVILVNLFFFFHPLHVSVTEIVMDEKDKALEITMRVFVDDLELAFRRKQSEPELDILNLKGDHSLDRIAAAYLNDHFGISLNGKKQLIHYIGHEREDDAFIFYCEVSQVKAWQTISVQNDIITEIHDDQSNLVHVTVAEVVRSLRLTREKTNDKITFQAK